MSVNNLQSLINGKWFIEQTHAKALLTPFFAILNKVQVEKQDTIDFSVLTVQTNQQISGSSFTSSKNEEDYILIVDIKDPIYKYNQECGPRGTKSKQATMQRFEKDIHCKGVVLDIDSGGGQVSGTPEFHDFIKAYSKPVVTYTDGYMCSAAYYLGSAADHVIANKRAEKIGSIGTMISFLDMTGYYAKKGAKLITAYASKSTDKNKDFEELVNGNPEGYIKNELDPITDIFHNDMNSARTSLDSKVLSGGTFNPEQSITLGLIDAIGTMQDAIDKVHELSTANTTQTQTQNSHTMSKEFKNVQEILGYEAAIDSNDKGVYFSEEEVQTIEDALENNATTTTDAVALVQENLDTVTATNTATETAIDAALEAAEIERGTMTSVEAIAELSAKVAEYGNFDGAKNTTIKDDANDDNTGDNTIVSGVNIDQALNC